eukprot:GFUD01048708.1.p1 GENE.GFUD01048708.1~~GFUD01048708.1.p1  ORF type:complete len:615 (+),score=153.97 GFUD01048708.1:56-1900(+)
MALTISEVERLKRKLRKKLRQIENLEIVDRELNDEELDKCSKKLEIRAELSELIKVCEVKDTEEVENSFTFIEKEDYSPIETINESTESIREEHLGFWKLEDSESSDEMKRKSSEYEPTNYCDKIVEKKPCLESVQTGSKPEPDKAAPVQSSDKKTVTQPVGSSESCGTKVKKNDRPTETCREPQLKANQKVKPAATKPSVPSDLAKWRKVSWSVEELCGHDDLVLDCDVDINLGLAITCSRDTTVKVWSLSSGSLVHSLRGHTGAVTGVRFVSTEATEAIALALDVPDLKICAVSGSQDCSVKVWDLVSGSLVKSYYTYNGITRLEVVPDTTCTLTGTDGGKLELYDMATGLCPFSQRVHEDAVTALCVKQGEQPALLSGGEDGIIKLFSLEEDTLRCLFVSENVKADPDTSVHNRPVYSITIGASGSLYYGDDGCNIKAVDWKRGRLRKIANHTEDIGFTDAVMVAGDLLVASTYDIDTGQGGLNLFYELPEGGPSPRYVATLMDGDTSRISSLRAKISNGSLTVISCGQEVKLWRQETVKGQKSKDGSTSVRGCVLTLDKGLVYDSGSDGELDSDAEDGVRSCGVGTGVGVGDNVVPYDSKSTGFCNCNIM